MPKTSDERGRLTTNTTGSAALLEPLRHRAADALGAWLDAVFVPQCLGCGHAGSHFCDCCRAEVHPLPPRWCDSCGQTLAWPRATRARRGAEPCLECRRAPLPLAGLRSVGRLEGPLRRAVHRLKYRGRQGAARALADLLVPVAKGLAIPAGQLGRLILLPVPLHAERERERGYNQAALLARPLAGSLAAPYAPELIRRLRSTVPQVGLSRQQRQVNVRGAFAASPRLAGRVVVLVDDVATTGSTLGSAADACRAAGASSVYAVTLAREA